MNKVAILIDGGFFLKRLPQIRTRLNIHDTEAIHHELRELVSTHLRYLANLQTVNIHRQRPSKKMRKSPAYPPGEHAPPMMMEPNWFSQLYRCFYYDASPYTGTGHLPISKAFIDFDKSDEARLRRDLFNRLKKEPNFALRLGQCVSDPDYNWRLPSKTLKTLVNKNATFEELSDADFRPAIRQKGVDIRMGIDIASITLKQQANIFVLVTGDADFVPAAKLARREGCKVILDPLYLQVRDDLFEHIDGLRSGLSRKTNTPSKDEI